MKISFVNKEPKYLKVFTFHTNYLPILYLLICHHAFQVLLHFIIPIIWLTRLNRLELITL
jgi:hypothetical protein